MFLPTQPFSAKTIYLISLLSIYDHIDMNQHNTDTFPSAPELHDTPKKDIEECNINIFMIDKKKNNNVFIYKHTGPSADLLGPGTRTIIRAPLSQANNSKK